MLYVSIVIFLLMIVVNVLFQIASIFRLGIPLPYALFVAILFPDFVHYHETLTTLIFIALLAMVILSWVVTIRRRMLKKKQRQAGIESAVR